MSPALTVRGGYNYTPSATTWAGRASSTTSGPASHCRKGYGCTSGRSACSTRAAS